MARLSKHKRDELKAKGLWHVKPKGPDEGLSFAEGAAEFTRLAEEANQMPVPFSHVIDSDVIPAMAYYPDLQAYQSGVMSCLDWMDDIGYDGFYHIGDDDTTRRDSLAGSLFLAMAARVAETHGLDTASETFPVPVGYVPEQLNVFIEHIGAFELDGNRFEFSDIAGFVKRCLRSAFFSLTEGWYNGVMSFTLPVSQKDSDFAATFSPFLKAWLYSTSGVSVSERTLRQSLFSGLCPGELINGELVPSSEVWETVKPYFFGVKDGPSLKKHILTGSATAPMRFYGVMIPPDLDPMWNMSLRDLCKEIRTFVPQPVVKATPVQYQDSSSPFGSPLQLVRCYVPPSGRFKYFRAPEAFSLEQSLEGCCVTSVFGAWGRCDSVRVLGRFVPGFDPDISLFWKDIVPEVEDRNWDVHF